MERSYSTGSIYPQNSRDIINKKPLKNRTIQSSKENYCIFILSIETEDVPSILKEFIVQTKSQKRQFVVSIVLDEITKEISLEKEIRKTKSRETQDGILSSSKISMSYQPSPDEILVRTKIQIDKCIEGNDALLAELETMKNIDILDYWKNNINGTRDFKMENGHDTKRSDTAKTTDSESGSKRKKKRIRDKAMSTNSISKDGTNHTSNGEKVPEFQNNIRQLKSLSSIQLIVHQFTQIDDSSKVAKKEYIIDYPKNGPILYIVIIGSVSSEFCLSLVREKYQVDAVISFCPSDLRSFSSLSERLSASDETKAICLFDMMLPRISKCDAAFSSGQIYDELCWLLFDIEIKKRQYAIYLDNIKEIDIGMKEDCHVEQEVIKQEDTSSPSDALDTIFIPLYLDELLNTVVESIQNFPAMRRLPSEPSLQTDDNNIPLMKIDGKIIVEFKNEILKDFLSLENLNEHIYLKCIEQNGNCELISSLLCHIGRIKSQVVEPSRSSSITTFTLKSTTSFCQSNQIAYFEMLSKDTLVQRLKHACQHYDHYTMDYSKQKDEIDIRFYNKPEQFTEKTNKIHIPTKVCFRDYCKYVADDIKEWTEQQSIAYKKRMEEAKTDRKFNEHGIVDADFVFNPSLKKSEAISLEKLTSNDNSGSVQNFEVESLVSKENDINNNESEIKHPLIAYNLSDTWYEIISTEAKFRTTGGVTQIEKVCFPAGESFLRIDFDCHGNHFFFSRSCPASNDSLGMRALWKNGSIINLQVMKSTGKPEIMSDPDGNSTIVYFPIHIRWPTGLEINTIYDDQTGKVVYIEQVPKGLETSEVKRVYYTNGTVTIYHKDGRVDILTPSGTTYEAMRYSGNKIGSFTDLGSKTKNPHSRNIEPGKYEHEKNFIEKLNADFAQSRYKFVTPDGYTIEVSPGNSIHENGRKHYIEWRDYAVGECFCMIEDGIKTLLASDKYKVYYPNGTMITTFIDDYIMANPLTEDTESFTNVEFSENVGASCSAMRITESVIAKLLDEAHSSIDSYVTVNRSYLIQHENYATILFDKDQINIGCPDEMDFILQNNKLEINIKNEFSIRCSPEECTVHRYSATDQDKSAQAIFDFRSQADPFVHIKSELGEELNVSQDGKMYYTSEFPANPSSNTSPNEKRIVITRNMEGYEGYSRAEIKEKIESYRKSECIMEVSDDILTVLQPFRKLNEIFRMPIPNLNTFIDKFEPKGRSCEVIVRQADDPNVLKNVMTVRSFVSVSEYFHRMKPSIIIGTPKISLSSEEVCYDDRVLHYLERECIRTIETHLNKLNSIKINSQGSSVIPLHRSKKSDKLNRQRMHIYQQILRCDLFPNYEDFKSADYQVKNMDITEYDHNLTGRTTNITI